MSWPCLARISCEFGNGVRRRTLVRLLNSNRVTNPAATNAMHTTAARTERAPVSSDAATISGDGVSPAASASASGSPPGSARATASADCGRLAASGSRHFAIRRSTAGSTSLITLAALGTAVRSRVSNARLPVNISKSTRPSE